MLIGLGHTRRLGLLSSAAAQVEAGNYSVIVPTEADDEVGKTAAAFNSMVAEIASRTRQLLQEEKRTQSLLTENRLLIQKSLEVQEEERKHLARELHDELGQCITAIQADAESIRDLSPGCDRRLVASIDAILNVSAHIYDVVHSMMRRLRPSVLDEHGLVEALKDEIAAWSKRNPLVVCTHYFQGELSALGERVNITIYRIVQECLTNIAKHADAGLVLIELINDETGLELRVSDDGVGMEMPAPVYGQGLGLIGMRERIQALKGMCTYETSGDGGFRVIIRIPQNAGL